MIRIHGTLHEQLARCEQEIEECEGKLLDPTYSDHRGAMQGWADQSINRLYILEEIEAEVVA